MTGTPIGPPVSEGIEYTIIKGGGSWNPCDPANPPVDPLNPGCDGNPGTITGDGQLVGFGSRSPYSFNSTEINLGEKDTLNGYQIQMRYYKQYLTQNANPNTGQEALYTRTYENFEIVEQEMNYNGDCPFTNSKESQYFTEDPGTVSVATAGIKNDAAYAYPRVFDESDIKYFPRLSTSQQNPVTNGVLPVEPHDPDADPPVYPIDALLAFLPDERGSVTVSHTLTTKYKKGSGTQTSEITISQTVTQPMGSGGNPFEGYKEKLRAVEELSYFYHKLPHIGLYPPPDTPGFDLPVYDDDGDLTGELNEPVTMVQLTRKSYPWDFKNEEYPPYPEKACE